MKRSISIAALLMLVASSVSAQYGDRGIVCAQYEKTGKTYLTEATVVDGLRYNRMIDSNFWRPEDVFTLIWWQEGEVSVIKMRGTFLYAASPLRGDTGRHWAKHGVDQAENNWRIWGASGIEISMRECLR